MEEGNGLSPFSVDMDSKADVMNIIEYFFRPPERDLWENPENENSTNPSYNGDGEDDADANHTCCTIPFFVNNIKSLYLDKYMDIEIIDSADVDENHD